MIFINSKSSPLLHYLLREPLRLAVSLLLLSSFKLSFAADDYTVELYDTYCQACHTAAGANVPVAFNQSDWQQRRKAAGGFENLVNNAIVGVGNMPAQGSCMECTYEDFEELINYMSAVKTD